MDGDDVYEYSFWWGERRALVAKKSKRSEQKSTDRVASWEVDRVEGLRMTSYSRRRRPGQKADG